MLKSQSVILLLFQIDHHRSFFTKPFSYLSISLSPINSYFCGQNRYFQAFPERLSTKYRNNVELSVIKQKSLLLRLIRVFIITIIIIIIYLMQKGKGKIYLLIGYLGSGKTTFIRNLLNNKGGEKYAIIQNQFAEGVMGIQQSLIMDQSGVPFSSFLELPNGCICCSAKNDLVAGVQYILQKTDVNNIVVQTNGLADPAESIKQFWFDEKLEMNAELHSIIAIISAQKYSELLKENLFHKQIVYADRVLLTFIDKSTPQEIQAIEKAIEEENNECLIAKNNSYNILQFLSGDGLFDVKKLATLSGPKQIQGEKRKHLHKGIKSFCLKGHTEFKAKGQFQCAIGELLWESGLKILRMKGIISLPDNQYAYQLQAVDDIFQLKISKTLREKVKMETTILVIGQGVKQQDLQAHLKMK